MCAAAQLRNLILNGLTAVNGNDAHAVNIAGQLADLITSLHGKLTRRTEYQRLHLAAVCVRGALLYGRNAKGKRFAGAGMRFADDISAAENQRNGLRLNFGRMLIGNVVQRTQNGLGERELVKRNFKIVCQKNNLQRFEYR